MHFATERRTAVSSLSMEARRAFLNKVVADILAEFPGFSASPAGDGGFALTNPRGRLVGRATPMPDGLDVQAASGGLDIEDRIPLARIRKAFDDATERAGLVACLQELHDLLHELQNAPEDLVRRINAATVRASTNEILQAAKRATCDLKRKEPL